MTTFLDFVTEKQLSFIRNMFDRKDLTLSNKIETIKKYDALFKKMLYCCESKDTEVGDTFDDCIAEFIDQ